MITTLTTIATFVALITLVTIRPNLRAKVSVIKKAKLFDQELPNQFYIGLTVENNGALGVYYRVMNLSEETFELTQRRTQLQRIGYNINGNDPAGFYQEKIFDPVIYENSSKQSYNARMAIGYKSRHLLPAGSTTESNKHLVGTYTLCEVNHIDYDKSVSNPDFASWVRVEPASGFWGLPFIKRLNTRYLYFTSSTLLVEGVDRL